MMSPRQYKSLYESIDVPLEDGTSANVAINQYRLASRNYATAAANTFLTTLKRRGIDMVLQVSVPGGTVRVDPRLTAHADALKKGQRDLVLSTQGLAKNDTRVDTRITNWDKLARLVFAGKGSPEACQIVLQLANHWGLAPNVKDYAESAMGLDCNGFVGNYIWHIKQKNPWYSLGAGDHDLGPDSPIRTGFYEKYQSRLVNKWEALDTEKQYIFMRVGGDKVVINGGTTGAIGHITITEPGRRDPRTPQNGSGAFAIWVVESTGGHNPGLCEGWYSCQSAANGVFSVYREAMLPGHEYYDFRIAAIS
jgi:hypothetical protein